MEEIESQHSWKKLKNYDFIEVWKTPTKFLVCYKYKKVFKFCDTLDESIKLMIQLHDQLVDNLE